MAEERHRLTRRNGKKKISHGEWAHEPPDNHFRK
jgi:hypothetical protein